jgi:hypothetical protein
VLQVLHDFVPHHAGGAELYAFYLSRIPVFDDCTGPKKYRTSGDAAGMPATVPRERPAVRRRA